jgi:hypothetical protein
MKYFIIPAIIFFLCSQHLESQIADHTSIEIHPRLSFYSHEKEGEFLIHIPSSVRGGNSHLLIKTGKDTIVKWSGIPSTDILRIHFKIDLKVAAYPVEAILRSDQNPGKVYIAKTNLRILTYKPNEVKTDRLTGGLIVNRRPFFPFGFYCYSPMDPGLPEEEVIKGFNMISPYQKILPESFHERRAYMDRCAQLGMKVHYNLLSVSGGGGVGSKIEGLSPEEKRKRLIEEIIAFRDHPALLGWYIADEPNGYKVPPAELEEIYQAVTQNDPWHPVSIVFMAPFNAAKKYRNALDIVMADPYPVPDLPVSMVGNVASELRREFSGKIPVWIVPQAFGGGEIWSREPTYQEVRSMTWQAIINGASGIQYFVRHGPNYFPKSTVTWSECGRMAMEVAELTPWLLSDEKANKVESSSANVLVTSRIHNGKLMILAVNKINEFVDATLRISGLSGTRARSLFENRLVSVNEGTIRDHLPPYGTHVYMINLNAGKITNTWSEKNLLRDPGFEDLSSPGIPSACYARPGGDKGATYFLDSREHFEGDHSLRLITPEKNKSVTIRFFPVRVKAGSSYVISLWAKSDPEQRFSKLDPCQSKHPCNK